MSASRSAEYWRNRAAQTRARIGSVYERNSRVDLLRLAEEYDRLAALSEHWQAPSPRR
jgi:hypothetical protein